MRNPSLLVLAGLALFPTVGFAGTRVIDGNPSDWTGTPPGQIHESTISGDEWIYRGEVGDVRTDAGGTVSNFDLTEVRLTRDATYLYILARYADITALDEVSLCMGFDNDQSAGDSNGLGFNGDDSGVVYAGTATNPEYLVQVHNSPNPATEVEFFHDAGLGSWFNNSTTENIAWISDANNVVEIRLRLTDLEMTTSSTFGFSLLTYDNGSASDPGLKGFNNLTDTTVDYPSSDALDGLGGTIGVSQNAFARVLGSGGTLTAPTAAALSLPALSSVPEWWHLEE